MSRLTPKSAPRFSPRREQHHFAEPYEKEAARTVSSTVHDLDFACLTTVESDKDVMTVDLGKQSWIVRSELGLVDQMVRDYKFVVESC